MKITDERTLSTSRRCCFAVLLLLLSGGCTSVGPQPRVEAPPPVPVDLTDLSETAPPVDTEALSPESVLLAEADQYYAMGVTEAASERYEEAEYNFEKALELLAKLDPETEFTDDQQEEVARLLKRIGTDYQNTVRAHGAAPDSPEMSAFMMRFEDLESLRNWRGYAEMQRSIAPDSVVYDIPIVWNDRVKNCIVYFQTLARPNMELYLTRAGKYLPMMREIFQSYGLPADLCYLPLIESGYNTSAYSYARAMGPWQFISSTGRNYGLERDWWIDERRDFVKSTHAAARYLGALYEMFDDWYLALAAYNGGEGRVARTIKSQHTRDFWQMRLRKETENYVPLYLAALIIAKDPERFGFHIEPESPIDFDLVTVDKPIELEVLARHLECDPDLLKQLNPEVLRGVTPPHKGTYRLRVPPGHKDRFDEVYAQIPQSERTEWVKHTIGRGETLSSIARRYGTSVQAIRDANRMRSSRIIAGHSLTVPVPLGYQPRPSTRAVTASTDGSYRVRAGDTLWDIARAHGTSVTSLASLNNLSSRRRIYPGQILRVPGDGAGSARGQAFTYVVKRGDNLTQIASRYGIAVSDILTLNRLSDPERLLVGMKLQIPATQ
jgi:membrane-bound lytic murein transglycosylase D